MPLEAEVESDETLLETALKPVEIDETLLLVDDRPVEREPTALPVVLATE
jgi:hypothetical protein